MFSFFGKKTIPLVKLEDIVWVSQNTRFTGLLQKAQKSIETKPVFVVYFFEDTKNTLQEIFKVAQKPYRFVASADDVKDDKHILIFSAKELVYHSAKLKNLFVSKEFEVLFAEHYPLNEPEEEVLHKISDISFRAKAYAYTDFEDGLLKQFDGERILEMMKKMGMNEHESISHSLVSKAIKEAKKKVSEKVRHEQTATSSQEWFRKNYKG
ncbi:MAG: hypothetical protein ACK40K_02270 [Raineya sp.]